VRLTIVPQQALEHFYCHVSTSSHQVSSIEANKPFSAETIRECLNEDIYSFSQNEICVVKSCLACNNV
jgi:hypothetical protein